MSKLNENAKLYEIGIDEGNEGTRTIASFNTEKEAKSFLYDYSLRHPKAKLFIDTCTNDFVDLEFKKSNKQKIKHKKVILGLNEIYKTYNECCNDKQALRVIKNAIAIIKTATPR